MKTQTVLKWVVGVAVVGFALWLGVTFPRSNPVINQIVGGSAGPTVYDHNFFLAGLTSGGTVATTSGLIATYTTSEKDFAQTPSYIVWTPNLALTVSVTATSTFPYVPNVGDVASVVIKNATTTAGSITFAEGSGLTIKHSEDDAGDAIAFTDVSRVTFIRTSSLTVTMMLEAFHDN